MKSRIRIEITLETKPKEKVYNQNNKKSLNGYSSLWSRKRWLSILYNSTSLAGRLSFTRSNRIQNDGND